MFIMCQLIDLLLIVERKLQAIKHALPLGNERSPRVTRDHVKINVLVKYYHNNLMYCGATCTIVFPLFTFATNLIVNIHVHVVCIHCTAWYELLAENVLYKMIAISKFF